MTKLIQAVTISAVLLVSASSAIGQVTFDVRIGQPPPPIIGGIGIHGATKGTSPAGVEIAANQTETHTMRALG